MPRQRRVAGDREVHHEPLLAAVLGHEADAGAHRGQRPAAAAAAGRRPRRGRRRACRSRRSPARPRCGPRRRARPARRSRPPRTSKLTSKNTPSRVRRCTLRTRLADLGVLLGEQRAELAPDHPPDHLVGRHVGDRRVVHDGAVAHHGDGVADREHLVEAVGDEQHGRALLAQRPDDREQPLDLRARQRGGRLVHDQHARLEAERLRDLDDLLVGDREAADGALGVERARRGGRAGPGRGCASRRGRSGRSAPSGW